MTVSLPTGGKVMGLFVYNVMYAFQENKKQTEELNFSQIKKVLLSFYEKIRHIEDKFEDGCITAFKLNILLDHIFEEASENIAALGSCSYDIESLENLCELNFMVQSDSVDRIETAATTTAQVTTGFQDLAEEKEVMVDVVNNLYTPTTSVNSGISDFLCRPVNIHETTWTLGNPVDTSFAPWNLFFDHTSIKKKIDNYAFIRCDLHLKFVINASPFYYGAILASYNPLNNFYSSATVPAASADVLVPFSQRPNIVVTPQDNEAGEMILPFVYPFEWLKLGSAQDLINMGRIHIDSFGLLSTVGTSTAPITMQVYAWAENVVLSGLTVDLAVQSDTYHKGPLSKPASAVARATGLLSSIPVIGPFMTATSLAAQSVSDIAAVFGYTKVPVLNDVQAFKNLPFHGLATAEVSDCTERLCIDSKNEMTIDTRVIGDVDSDSLNLSKFVQRKSYLTKFPWAVSDPSGTRIWNTRVTPSLSSFVVSTGETIINGTPMWLVANMFDYWRGDIIFEFRVVCSQYHRGRIRVSWDPVGEIATTDESTTEVFNTIIDISTKTQSTVRVPYTQRSAYQKIGKDADEVLYNNTGALLKDTFDLTNGILTVRVLNELTAPTTVGDIEILVSVRGAENLEFASPADIPSDLAYYTVQSQEAEADFAGMSTTDPNINLVYMGEKVVNLRSLMMRCNYLRTDVTSTSLAGELFHRQITNRRPLYKGFDPAGINVADENVGAGTAPYNFVENTPYHMISQCFLGERGSFTWKYNLDGADNSSITVSRPKLPLLTANYGFASGALYSFTYNRKKSYFVDNEASNSGIAVINQTTNTGLSVNAPQYSIVSFLDTAPAYRTQGLTNISGDDSLRITYVARRTKDDVGGIPGFDYFHHYFQVGADYAPVFFMNVPTMYSYDTVPTGS